MRVKASLLLGLALVFGGLAAYMVNQIVSSQINEQAAPVAQPSVQPAVVAAADLPAGTQLHRSHLRVVQLPRDAYPAGSFGSVDALLEDGAPLVTSAIAAGEIILPARLSTGIVHRGLTARIPEGLRGIAIPVNAVRGVGGFVLPGDRVDVLHTTAVGRRDGQPVTRTLLQDITVLAVDQRSSETEENPIVVNVVTLLADPEQTKQLTLAQQAGTLTLTLRNAADQAEDRSSTVAMNNLWSFGPGDGSAPVRPPPPPRPVEVIRGLVVNQQTISDAANSTASN